MTRLEKALKQGVAQNRHQSSIDYIRLELNRYLEYKSVDAMTDSLIESLWSEFSESWYAASWMAVDSDRVYNFKEYLLS